MGAGRRLELCRRRGVLERAPVRRAGDDVGYDVFLEHPEYPRFLARQVELLDPRPGEHLADFGCGTGNLLLALLDAYRDGEAPASLTFLDLVPEGVERTREKVLAACSPRAGLAVPGLRGAWWRTWRSRASPPSPTSSTAACRASRGWSTGSRGCRYATARKLAEGYGKELHAILRGAPAAPGRVRELCPALDDAGGGDRPGARPRRALPARPRHR